MYADGHCRISVPDFAEPSIFMLLSVVPSAEIVPVRVIGVVVPFRVPAIVKLFPLSVIGPVISPSLWDIKAVPSEDTTIVKVSVLPASSSCPEYIPD